MPLSTVSARVEKSDKAAFDEFCDNVGLSTSSAINLFIKAVLRERKIPFEISEPDPFYGDSNQAYLKKSLDELKAGKGKDHELIEVADD